MKDKVKNELISDREFDKLRNQVENQLVSANSRVAGIAESLATYYLFYGDTELINKEIDRYMAVTKEDIQAAAKKYLNADNRVTLTYLAKPNDKS